MGFSCPIDPLFVFQYNTPVPGGLIENELVHVFGGRHDGQIKPDPAEVGEWKWISFADLVADIAARPDAYTVWFKHYVDKHRGILSKWIGAG
jgi:isopentenyl-diphosphate delta-isomerase